MRQVVAIVLCVGLCVAPALASAQISRDVAEAAMDEFVEIEMNDGSSVVGFLMGVGEGSLVVRVRSGRLVELNRADVAALFVDSTRAPVESSPAPRGPVQPNEADLAPPRESAFDPSWVTEAEYQYALAQYRPGRSMKLFGNVAIALAGVALFSGFSTRASYKNQYCYDSYSFNDDYDCNESVRRASIAMFTLAPILFGGGLTMSIIGGKRKAEYGPTIQTYRRQRADRAASDSSTSAFVVSPMVSREGGGLRLNVSF